VKTDKVIKDRQTRKITEREKRKMKVEVEKKRLNK
jgi:hypothetical protein